MKVLEKGGSLISMDVNKVKQTLSRLPTIDTAMQGKQI